MLGGSGTNTAWENRGGRGGKNVVYTGGTTPSLVDERLLFLFYGDHGAKLIDVVSLDGEAHDDGRDGGGRGLVTVVRRGRMEVDTQRMGSGRVRDSETTLFRVGEKGCRVDRLLILDWISAPLSYRRECRRDIRQMAIRKCLCKRR
jgi:hypothetical protein